jgi:hypothetical protein
MSNGVGYKHPPIEMRFQKGKSGNPRGRPKDQSKELSAIAAKILERKIPITINGKRVRVSYRQAFMEVLARKALGGDIKAMEYLFGQCPAEAQNELIKFTLSLGDGVPDATGTRLIRSNNKE